MRSSTRAVQAVLAACVLVLAGCGGNDDGPTLTDPAEIVTAALAATDEATGVHLEIAIDGTAAISLPIGGISGPGTPIELTGTTATADVDLANTAARATFAMPNVFGLAGEVIAVDGRVYIKTTLTGPLYQASSGDGAPIDPSGVSGVIDSLGTVLLGEGVGLTKGDDVACGSKQCYTVTASVTASGAGLDGVGPLAGMIDLTDAVLDLTIRVEQASPNHLAGIQAVLTTSDGNSVVIDVTASKWNDPVTIDAPPPDQIKPSVG